MKVQLLSSVLTTTVLVICSCQPKLAINSEIKTVEVNVDHFIKDKLIAPITQKTVKLRGIETLCYIIKSKSQPSEHAMGPWCPTTIEDGKENGGLWFKDGKMYDVDGHFIANLADFYQDEKWKLFRADGSVKVTDTKAACRAAAKPKVEKEYHNYCVQCLPSYFEDQYVTLTIPVKPVYLEKTTELQRNGLGLAFNGVIFEGPAPTHAILAAHTLAPLDDNGGHVNPHIGYHYHAATGATKEIEQADGHAPMIGYAIDGFAIYALLDKNQEPPKDLDACGGHEDDVRGYHYHVGTPGGNQIITCLHGIVGSVDVHE